MTDSIELEYKVGEVWFKKPFPPKQAEKVLKAKRSNPNQSWRLPDDSGFEFKDGKLLAKKAKVKTIQEEKKE